MRKITSVFTTILFTALFTCAACSPPGGTGSTASAPAQTPTPKIVSFTKVISTAIPTITATPIGALASTATPAALRDPLENPLTGLKVDSTAVLAHRPLMVRVGNDTGARPQVGLSQADMVYEEVVELWVTRFTAIFWGEMPEMIAPVRSARLINLQLVPQYQGALANSGGSDGVRWELSQAPIVNLDEYFNPAPYFYRENEGWQTRLAIDGVKAQKYLQQKKWDTPVTLRGFVFSDTPPAGETGDYLHIPYPKQTSDTVWEYDSAAGRYLRLINGEELTDFNTKKQISAANVIVYFAEHQSTDIVEDTNGATSIRIIVNGEGEAWVLRDGVLIKGKWKTDGKQTPQFIDNSGKDIPLKRGNTWVEVVPPDYKIDLKPADENS